MFPDNYQVSPHVLRFFVQVLFWQLRQRFRLLGRYGLDQSECILCVHTIEGLRASGRFDSEGGDKLSPPFVERAVAFSQLFDVIRCIGRICKCKNNINNHKMPLFIVPCSSDLLLLKNNVPVPQVRGALLANLGTLNIACLEIPIEY